ncbi:TPA: lantibiotic ABC transporter ATP-binding protein, partial [Staphylococcus aureus]|nr:lantibiotic ABC transporter ATP-binding protein [Staphylococcus aureus]
INKGKLVIETTEEELKKYKDNDLESVLLNILDKENQT